MRVDYHIQIDITEDRLFIITSGQKLSSNNLRKVDRKLLKKVAKTLKKIEQRMILEAQNLDYEAVPRTSQMFPVPDRL